MYPTLYPDRQAGHDACCNAAKWAHSLCVYVCNPWPTFLHLDVTPLHMPPAQHALKLMWISWAQRKITFAVRVLTLVWRRVCSFLILQKLFCFCCCAEFFFPLSALLRNRLFFSWIMAILLSVSCNNEASKRSQHWLIYCWNYLRFQYLVYIR